MSPSGHLCAEIRLASLDFFWKNWDLQNLMEKNGVEKVELFLFCLDSLEPLAEKEMGEYQPRCLALGYCLKKKKGHQEELPHPTVRWGV